MPSSCSTSLILPRHFMKVSTNCTCSRLRLPSLPGTKAPSMPVPHCPHCKRVMVSALSHIGHLPGIWFINLVLRIDFLNSRIQFLELGYILARFSAPVKGFLEKFNMNFKFPYFGIDFHFRKHLLTVCRPLWYDAPNNLRSRNVAVVPLFAPAHNERSTAMFALPRQFAALLFLSALLAFLL